MGIPRTAWMIALTGLCVIAFQNCGEMHVLNPDSSSLSQRSLSQSTYAFVPFVPSASPADFTNPNSWTIGPIINGRSYSVGMPLHPSSHPEGWAFDILKAPNSVNYVTAPCGSLAGKSEIVLKYRVEADPSVTIHPTKMPDSPSMLSLYFQRAGDNWSGAGVYETFRWFSPILHSPIRSGDYELIVPLDANWTAIMTSSAEGNPTAFESAKANCGQVGFVLGGGDGRGHGVSATGPAKFIVKSFEIRGPDTPTATPTPNPAPAPTPITIPTPRPITIPTPAPTPSRPGMSPLCSYFPTVCK